VLDDLRELATGECETDQSDHDLDGPHRDAGRSRPSEDRGEWHPRQDPQPDAETQHERAGAPWSVFVGGGLDCRH
jgi:hypothetical protein